MAAFDGFTSSDFDAFEEKKWSSHAFNRERLEVKLKLSAMGKELGNGLASSLPGQEMGITEERPSIFNQHQVRDITLYFLREDEARRTLGGILDREQSIADNMQDPALHHRHINLGLRIHHGGAEAGLWLHENAWIDWKNLARRCHEYWERDKLSELLSSLPPMVRYVRGQGLGQGDRPAREMSGEEILVGFGQQGPWSLFGRALPRFDPVVESPVLLTAVAELFEALIPLHAFISWRRDNDHHQLTEVIKEQKKKAMLQFSSLQPGDEVRVMKGLAAGRLGVVEAIERKGTVKVRLGAVVVALKVEELGKP